MRSITKFVGLASVCLPLVSGGPSAMLCACPPAGGGGYPNYSTAPRVTRMVITAPATPAHRPAVVAAPSVPATRQPQASLRPNPTYVVCTQDASGQWWLRHTTTSQSAAQQLKARFESEGVKAWAMEAIPLPEGRSYTMANGEIAIALAISLGKDAHAVAIGPSGRAEALASK